MRSVPFDFLFRDIEISFTGDLLSLKNKKFFRTWKLNNGWSTTAFGIKYDVSRKMESHVDWCITACSGRAELLSIKAEVINDSFVKIISVFHYPESQLFLKHEVDCYPEISGVRTILSLKPEKEIPASGRTPERDQLPQYVSGYTESLPIHLTGAEYLAFGFNNDSQHRYTLETPILTEIRGTVKPGSGCESIANCSGIILQGDQKSGIILLKESHKCANSPGISTGEFLIRKNILISTGLGFSDGSPHWLAGSEYHQTWATWAIPFVNGESGAIQALKEFDRARYPFRFDRDMFIAMNTWGSRGDGMLSRMAATEDNVLAELESCADLGIDLLQIDDGWQFDPGTADFQNCAWEPSQKGFPHGWNAVKQRAAELKMKLGLWAAPDFISAEQLLKNIREGGFRRIKLDFLNLSRRNLLDEIIVYAKKIIEGSEEPVGINWDITENCPRMGFYFGREFGNIFLQNCENSPQGATFKRFIAYDPEVTLNQTWLLAKYFNLNQVQITIQRVTESPHGKEYPQDYACGLALMGNPLFFVETRRFSETEREQIKQVLSVYRVHRKKILSGYIEPVGNQPDGSVWTGFQCICSDNEGYLTIFREKDSADESFPIRLNVPAGKKIQLQNLYQGNDTVLEPDNNGKYLFTGLSRKSWGFYQYKVLES